MLAHTFSSKGFISEVISSLTVKGDNTALSNTGRKRLCKRSGILRTFGYLVCNEDQEHVPMSCLSVAAPPLVAVVISKMYLGIRLQAGVSI